MKTVKRVVIKGSNEGSEGCSSFTVASLHYDIQVGRAALGRNFEVTIPEDTIRNMQCTMKSVCN